jgi:hypothetical protein
MDGLQERLNVSEREAGRLRSEVALRDEVLLRQREELETASHVRNLTVCVWLLTTPNRIWMSASDACLRSSGLYSLCRPAQKCPNARSGPVHASGSVLTCPEQETLKRDLDKAQQTVLAHQEHVAFLNRELEGLKQEIAGLCERRGCLVID